MNNSAGKQLAEVSVVIPTYNREQVLLQTIDELLALKHSATEILVVDQSSEHLADTTNRLSQLNEDGRINWVRLSQASIPNAMNIGAVKARADIVLFLDDDVLIPSELILEHAREYLDSEIHAVAGQVIQSWETELESDQPSFRNNHTIDPDAFRFNSSQRMEVRRFIGCNVSFRKQDLLAVGGFDNNFAKVAYRFEAECAERFTASGRILMFNPKASVKHLKELSGGTRSFGDHRRTITPSHSVGRYYYFLVVKNQHKQWWRFFSSPFSSCLTKFHASHPWYIPVTLFAEFSGMLWAISLKIKGQKLLEPNSFLSGN